MNNFCKSGISAGDNIEKWVGEKNDLVFHLKHLKNILPPHLKLEDAKLYPILLESKDKKIREVAKKYSDEMILISKRTLSFFETYAHLTVDDISQNKNFRLDLNTVITIVKKRIDLEERELYPLHCKVKK